MSAMTFSNRKTSSAQSREKRLHFEWHFLPLVLPRSSSEGLAKIRLSAYSGTPSALPM